MGAGKERKSNNKECEGRCLALHEKAVQALILTLKRMSSCSFGPCFNKVHRASMTVEACLVLPLFLFAFLNLISIVEIYRLQGALSAAMHDTIKQMAVYGYEYQKIGGGGAGMAESLGLTYIVAAGKVRTKLGTAYLDNSPLAGGASSISWLRSSVMQKEDCIDLVAEYQIRPPSAVAGWKQRTMYNRMRTRAWTGYDNAGSGGSQSSGEEIVYITPEECLSSFAGMPLFKIIDCGSGQELSRDTAKSGRGKVLSLRGVRGVWRQRGLYHRIWQPLPYNPWMQQSEKNDYGSANF